MKNWHLSLLWKFAVNFLDQASLKPFCSANARISAGNGLVVSSHNLDISPTEEQLGFRTEKQFEGEVG